LLLPIDLQLELLTSATTAASEAAAAAGSLSSASSVSGGKSASSLSALSLRGLWRSAFRSLRRNGRPETDRSKELTPSGGGDSIYVPNCGRLSPKSVTILAQ
jgi:hypothetical protein